MVKVRFMVTVRIRPRMWLAKRDGIDKSVTGERERRGVKEDREGGGEGEERLSLGDVRRRAN